MCARCGCYVNRRPTLPEELNRLYSFNRYWHTRQRLKGHPVIEQRKGHDLGDGRVDRWLSVIEQHAPPEGQAIEVGCAHGVLLAELKRRGYDCIGVEVDEQTVAWAQEDVNVEMRVGLFPMVELPRCDLFLSFDVIEHSLCPEEFLRGAARLLTPEGVAIIQTPIDRHQSEPPFADVFHSIFDDLEHNFIFSRKSIHKLAETAELEIIDEARGVIDLDIVVLRKATA